jgi:hypothetical protein
MDGQTDIESQTARQDKAHRRKFATFCHGRPEISTTTCKCQVS